MKPVLAAILVLVAGATLEFWALRNRAERICHTAHELARHGGTVGTWLKEASADPFLGSAALRGPPNSVIALYRDRSRRITAELSARFLPETALAAYTKLGLTRGEGPELQEALEGLRPASAALVCRAPAGVDTDAGELEKLVGTADQFWAERRAYAEVEKKEFARDQGIFCHGEDLLKKLRAVVSAAAESCRAAKPGSKLAKSCAGKVESTGSVEAEIEDLERQKDLNLRKLRQKWPEAVVAGLRC